MKFLKTLAKFSVGTWIQALLGLITTPVIAWFIVPEEFGKSSMFTLAYSLGSNIIVLALDQGFARFFNNEEDKGVLLKNTFYPLVLTSVLTVIALFVTKGWIGPFLFGSDNSGNILFLSFALLTGVFLRISTMALRMQSLASLYSFIQVFQAVINFLATLAYAKFVSADFKAVVFGLVISQAVTLIISIILNWKLWKLLLGKAAINQKLLKQMLIYSLPFVPTFLLDWLFQGIDRTFLRHYSGFDQIGLYATASKIAFSLNIIQTGFTAFWFPFSLDLYNRAPEEKSIYSAVFNSLTCAFGVLILLILTFKDLLTLVLPVSYHNVLYIFPFLLFVPMLYTLSEITVVGINFKQKTHQHLYIIILSLITNGSLAFLLVPGMGALGAAISMFGGYVIFFSGRTYFGCKNYQLKIEFGKLILSLTVLLVAVFLAIYSSYLHYFVSIFGIFLLIALYRKDILILKHI